VCNQLTSLLEFCAGTSPRIVQQWPKLRVPETAPTLDWKQRVEGRREPDTAQTGSDVHEKSYPIEVGVKGSMGYGRGYLFS